MSLDTFTRCRAPGCNWRVDATAPVRCYLHRGPAARQYETTEDGIEILRVRFMEREMDPDYDPEPDTLTAA
jgi:hypothetical protein